MYKLKKYKVARRLGAHLFEKTQTEKFANRTARRVGKTNQKHGRSMTDFGIQMMEKQRARALYGIRERQFGNYVARVIANTSSDPTVQLYELLETRLDNTVYRLGFAPTRQASRQMVGHGHIRVNGVRKDVASSTVRVGDVVTIRPGSASSKMFLDLAERMKGYTAPTWLSVDFGKIEGKVTGAPRLEKGVSNVDFGQIIEFYKR